MQVGMVHIIVGVRGNGGGSLHALAQEYWLVATVFFLHLIHGGEIEIGVMFCYKRERHGAVRGLLRCSLLLRTTLPGLL